MVYEADVFGRHLQYVGSFREVLAYQTIGMLVEPPFPGVVGSGEVAFYPRFLR